MRRSAVVLATLALGVLSGSAAAAPVPVTVEFQAFAPSALDVLPGDTVTWTNTSGRRHTVTADGGQFDSGDLPDGGVFTQTFNVLASYAYHCTVHPEMVGAVDVRRVTLEPLPPGLVPSGASVDIAGRTADVATPVRIERDTGTGFEALSTASPQGDGTWRARVTAATTAQYRAALGTDLSQTRQLLVIDKHVVLRSTPTGVSATVIPATPYARVALQLYRRERFGWWPVAVTRLDYLSQATFRVRGQVQARVAVLDRDGWTSIALSPVIRVGSGRPAAPHVGALNNAHHPPRPGGHPMGH